MNTFDVVAIATLVAVLTYARDVVAGFGRRRRQKTVEQTAAERNEVEIRGIVLGDAKDSLALTSALLLDQRLQIASMRDELALKQIEVSDLQREQGKLYALVGRLQTRISELERAAS